MESGDEPVELTGTMKLHTHNFERGNVQLISSKTANVTIDNPGTPADFAEQCAKRILSKEFEYHMAVNDNFKSLSDTTFKSLRRQLPVTKTKIDWSNYKCLNVGKELSQTQS